MLANLNSLAPRDRQAAVDQLLVEIHGAIGSFVAHYADQDRTAPAGGTRERAGIAAAMPEAGFDAMLRGHHVRAGRALLDWSMSDLADASGLSLSTVRRLEQGAEGVLTRNRRSAALALQAAGVGFLSLGNGAVAVVKLADAIL